MLNNALRICGAEFGNLFLFGDGAFREALNVNTPPAFEEFLHRGPVRPSPGTGLAQIVSTKQTAHIEDIRLLPAYSNGDPFVVAESRRQEFGRFSLSRCSGMTNLSA